MIGIKELVQNFKDGLPELKDIGKEGLGILGEGAKLVGSATCKGVAAGAKMAWDAATEVIADQGGPDYHYHLTLSNELASLDELRSEVENWFCRYVRGPIGSKDPYAKEILSALNGRNENLVTMCTTETDILTYSGTDDVQSFTLHAMFCTGHSMIFSVKCFESAHINQYMLKGF